MTSQNDYTQIRKDFKEVVNMTAGELEVWLKTPESKSVGQRRPGETESIGRQSGKHILKILRTKQADLTPEDYTRMRRVYSYVRRHAAQEPRNILTSRWRYSLMNWGHDPVKRIVLSG